VLRDSPVNAIGHSAVVERGEVGVLERAESGDHSIERLDPLRGALGGAAVEAMELRLPLRARVHHDVHLNRSAILLEIFERLLDQIPVEHVAGLEEIIALHAHRPAF
jgi:hypothetical protein